VCWFPWIDRGAPGTTRFSSWVVAAFARWPRFGAGRATWIVHAAFALACALAIAGLRVNDDLRQLQGSPPALVDAQQPAGDRGGHGITPGGSAGCVPAVSCQASASHSSRATMIALPASANRTDRS